MAPKAPGTSGSTTSGLLGGVFEVMGKGGLTGVPAAPSRDNGRGNDYMSCKGGGGSPGGVMDRGRNGGGW